MDKLLLCFLLYFTGGFNPAQATQVIPRLEGPAVNPGQGYDPRTGQWRSSCLTGDIAYAGRSLSQLNLDRQASRDTIISYMSSSLSGTASLFVASAKATVAYSRTVTEDQYSLTLTYMHDFRGKTLSLQNMRLTADGIRARNSRDQEFMKLLCGEAFVRNIRLGGTLFLSAHYEFANKEVLDEFKATLSFEVLGFEATKTFRHNSRSLNRNAVVTFAAWQTGGDPDLLTSLLEASEKKSCSLDRLEECEAVVDSLLHYATSRDGFASRLQNLEWREDGNYPALSYELSGFREAGFPELEPEEGALFDRVVEGTLESIAIDYATNVRDFERAKTLIDSGRLRSPDLDKVRAVYAVTRQNTGKLLMLRDRCMVTPSFCQKSWQQRQLTAYSREDLQIPERLYLYCLDTDQDLEPGGMGALFREVFQEGSYQTCEELEAKPERIRTLRLRQKNLDSLAPLKFFSELRDLDISHNQIRSLRPLSRLKNLHTMNFRNNQVADLGPLRFLSGLREINGSYNNIRLSGPLQRKGPERLWLHGNFLEDTSWFSGRQAQYHELVLSESALCTMERQKVFERGWIDQELLDIYSEAGFGPVYQNPEIPESPEAWLYCPLIAPSYEF